MNEDVFPLRAVSRPNSLPPPFQKPAKQAEVNFEDRKKAIQQA